MPVTSSSFPKQLLRHQPGFELPSFQLLEEKTKINAFPRPNQKPRYVCSSFISLFAFIPIVCLQVLPEPELHLSLVITELIMMDVLKNMFLWGGTINLKHSATEFHMNTCRCLIQNQTLGPLSSVLSTPNGSNSLKYYVEVLHITCYLIIVTRDARIELLLLTHDLAVPAFKKLLSCSNPQQDYSEVNSNLSNRVSIQEHVLKTIVLNTLIRTFHK